VIRPIALLRLEGAGKRQTRTIFMANVVPPPIVQELLEAIAKSTAV
jgi:hypothetical protein